MMNSRCSWKTITVGLLLAGAAPIPAATVRAEVRLVPAKRTVDARVDVHATARGPWSSLGLPTDQTLNPTGDLVGDGFPGTAGRGDRACAAWVRPTESQVLVAVGTEGAWTPPVALPAERAVGTPHPAVLADGAVLLGWNEVTPADGLQARIALVTPDGDSASEMFGGPSLILDGTELGADAALLALVDQGRGSFELVLASPIKPPNEPPRFLLQTVGRLDGRAGTVADAASAISPVIQPLVGEQGVLGLVHWWSDDHVLSYVLLGEDAIASPVRSLDSARGIGQSPRALLRQVMIAEGLQGKR